MVVLLLTLTILAGETFDHLTIRESDCWSDSICSLIFDMYDQTLLIFQYFHHPYPIHIQLGLPLFVAEDSSVK